MPRRLQRKLLLDSNVIGKICHPTKHQDVRVWFGAAVREHEVLLPEVGDYELRRELLRIGSRRSLRRLDELTRELRYVTVTTATWREAARPRGHVVRTAGGSRRRRARPACRSLRVPSTCLQMPSPA